MKKWFSGSVLALTLASLVQAAEAKTLEEILREKGVITEQDYKEAAREIGLASYRPGRGITVSARTAIPPLMSVAARRPAILLST